ncbi:MAG: alginate lyase family protein [Mariniphaga sp.]|nr:alginate lyase family protein [Mariniphaga sp.]
MKSTVLFLGLLFFCSALFSQESKTIALSLGKQETDLIINAAKKQLNAPPQTVTAARCKRSAGVANDYYSEGDYWWPDPKNPDGPYIQRDGESNPENFVAHREAVFRLSDIVSTLTSAYLLTSDTKYILPVQNHLKAWFIDPATRMNPDMLFSQAIKGRFTGRSIGLIDAIHFIEVARSVKILYDSQAINNEVYLGVKMWFSQFLDWMLTHPYGIDEMNAKNNHGTCWVMMAAAFADMTVDSAKLEFCRTRFKEVLLPNQMAEDGSFPLEIKRTKPYGYSLFNLDAMSTICKILSTPMNDLWHFTTTDGRNMGKAIEFMFPFVANKKSWPFSKDIMYWDEWPVRQPFLLFGAQAFHHQKYMNLYLSLKSDLTAYEVIRNVPVRHPLLWE